jgi:hypothetical protein
MCTGLNSDPGVLAEYGCSDKHLERSFWCCSSMVALWMALAGVVSKDNTGGWSWMGL